MSSDNIYRHILIDEQSITPKYVQLINSILKGVEQGNIGKDYQLPSINDLSYELDISRDTAEKAYRQLKQLGVVGSVPGKGYFISKTDVKQSIRVFLIFNKLSTHKKLIYDSFVKTLGEQAAIDFYIYNNDFSLFKKLLQNRREGYTHYVVIPHFLEGGDNAAEVINEINFEFKSPVENHILMVGDAAGLITPLCGNGMAMAIRAGNMVAEAVHSETNRREIEQRYARTWNEEFKTRLWVGRKVQHLFGSGRSSGFARRLIQHVPAVAQKVVKFTHGRPF